MCEVDRGNHQRLLFKIIFWLFIKIPNSWKREAFFQKLRFIFVLFPSESNSWIILTPNSYYLHHPNHELHTTVLVLDPSQSLLINPHSFISLLYKIVKDNLPSIVVYLPYQRPSYDRYYTIVPSSLGSCWNPTGGHYFFTSKLAQIQRLCQWSLIHPRYL